MRVIQVVPTPFGSAGLFGGGERYPLELARALAPHVECELLTFGANPYTIRERNGLTIRVVRPLHHIGGHPAHPVSPAVLGAAGRADIVHTHHMYSTPARIAAIAGRIRGRRLVVTDHGLKGRSWYGWWPALYDRFLMVSEYSATILHTPPGRTNVIYGGADPVQYAPDSTTRRAGVLFVGRITPHKGVDRLIEALPTGARLTVAGATGNDPKPPERDYPALLSHLARERDVTFLGPVPDDRLPRLYRQARVLVLPSVERSCYGRTIEVSELLGLVVLEAMASGTPVICSRVGGLPEVVQHGLTGFLVEPGNVDELRDRLDQVLRDPDLAARMGRNARELVLNRFTWRECANRCLAAYAELAT